MSSTYMPNLHKRINGTAQIGTSWVISYMIHCIQRWTQGTFWQFLFFWERFCELAAIREGFIRVGHFAVPPSGDELTKSSTRWSFIFFVQGSVFVIVVFALLEVDNIFECLDFLSGLTFCGYRASWARKTWRKSRVSFTFVCKDLHKHLFLWF